MSQCMYSITAYPQTQLMYSKAMIFHICTIHSDPGAHPDLPYPALLAHPYRGRLAQRLP